MSPSVAGPLYCADSGAETPAVVARKLGSGSAEMHGTPEERRAVRLAEVGVPFLVEAEEEDTESVRTVTPDERSRASPRGWRRTGGDTSERDVETASEATLRLRQRLADLPPPVRGEPVWHAATVGFRAGGPPSVQDPQPPEAEGMTSRGRLVAERTGAQRGVFPAPQLAAGEPQTLNNGWLLPARRRARPARDPPRWPAAVPVPDDAPRPHLSDIIRAQRLALEFPTPAEASRSGLQDPQPPAVLESRPAEAPRDTFGDQALAELRLLQNTVTRLNDRLEVARTNMAMLAAARSSLREHEENVERVAVQQMARVSGTPGRSDVATTPAPVPVPVPASAQLARRPSFPYPRNPSHPHHRPRLGAHPIALVINMDNLNSFDVNFDGNIVYRPISAREPDRELIARCLSMIPGGREGTPSRWMRLTGNGHGRPRRAGTSAGYWVRWVCAPDSHAGLRHRSLDMTSLPPITAFDFALSPPDDDAFIRADEIEFYTPRTRLDPALGPWMHSRVRVEPFENDPPVATWGTSAHVRQAVQQVGGLPLGHYMRYHLRERRVEARTPRDRSAHSASSSRGSLERVLDSDEALGMDMTSDAVPATIPPVNLIGETSDPDTAWLMSYEPAIGQIRASWRAHYRQTREENPEAGAAVFTESAMRREHFPRAGGPRNELWSRGQSCCSTGRVTLILASSHFRLPR